MTLGRLRLKLLLRWLKQVGPLLPVVAACAIGAAWLFCAVAGRWPSAAAVAALLMLLKLHRTRRDLHFLDTLLPHPALHAASEYTLLALLPCGALLLGGHPIHAAGLLAAAPLAALVPQRRPARRRLPWLRIGMLGHSPEWTAGIRRHPLVAATMPVAAALAACYPYAGFIALILGAFVCCGLYAGNEPLQLLLLPEQGSSRLLWRKIRAAWRNYFLLTAPFAAAACALHPRAAWLAALWLPLAALMLLYAVLAKYASYDPQNPDGSISTAAQIGLLGFFLPPLLPVTLCLTVIYALRAERNLNRYLYDYH